MNKPIDRDQVRMLVMELGYNRTAERLGIKAATIRQWAKRGHWNTPAVKHSQATVTTVTRPSDVLADELRENERQTRLSLSRYTRKAAKDSEAATLRDAPIVHKVAQTAGIVHQWGANDARTQILNVALLTGAEKPRPVDSQSVVLPSVESER